MSRNNKEKDNNVTKEESSVMDISDNNIPFRKNFQQNKNIKIINSDRNNRELNQTDMPSLKTFDKNKLNLNIKDDNNNNIIINNSIKGRMPSLSNLSTFSKENKCYIYFQSLCSIPFKKCYNVILLIFGILLLILRALYIFHLLKIEKKIGIINNYYFIIPEFILSFLIIIYYFINNCIIASYLMKNYIIMILHIFFFFNLIVELYIFISKTNRKFDKYISLFFSFILFLIPFINLIILNIENKRNKVALHNIDEIINFTENKNKKEGEIVQSGLYDEKYKINLGKKVKGIELIEEENEKNN